MKGDHKIESPTPRVIPPPPYAENALKFGLAPHINPRVDKRS
jgi:hypothetical protein